MSLDKTKKLVEWLEATQPEMQYSLEDMKELLSIAMTELSDQNDKTFDALPGAYFDAIIEGMKACGEYYLLDNKIENFKSRFQVKSERT